MAARASAALNKLGEVYLGQLSALVEPAHSAGAPVIGRLMLSASRVLRTINRVTSSRPVPLGNHLRDREMSWRLIEEENTQLLGDKDAASLGRQLDGLLAELASAFAGRSLPSAVETRIGPIRYGDYLRAHIIDLVALARFCGVQPEKDAEAEAVRALAGVLGERFPGQTIELRVPPLAAVQVGAFGEGPTHTRGTPPNVIETDPDTWLGLATGTLSWEEAHRQHLLRVSGVHADQAKRMLPVYRVIL